MTLPSYRYGDPADVAERDELHERRVVDGCTVCQHHHPQTWSCRIKRTPDLAKRYCDRWTIKHAELLPTTRGAR